MEELLTQSGLTNSQAEAYLFLLDNGSTTPPALAKALYLTRTNAYKVLDSLQELGLASRQEQKKKFVYSPADPSALASLVAEQRNLVTALEQNVKTAMGQLRAKYRKSTATSKIEVSHGTDAIIGAYTEQTERGVESIYFIKSRADIPFLGFEIMTKLRHLPAVNGMQRYGITPDVPEISKDPAADKHTNLTRVKIPADSYTAPVEWAVSGDELLIIKFDDDGQVIRIQDPEVADGFRQIWNLAAKSKN